MAADAVMTTDRRRVGWARSWKFLLVTEVPRRDRLLSRCRPHELVVSRVRTILSPLRPNGLRPPVMCTASTYVCTQ